MQKILPFLAPKLILSNWRIYLFVGEKWKYFQSWLHSCYHVLQIPSPPPPSFPLSLYLTASLSFMKMQWKKKGVGGGMGGCWCTLSVQFIISAHLIIVLLFHTYCTDKIMQVTWTMAVELIYTSIIPHNFFYRQAT